MLCASTTACSAGRTGEAYAQLLWTGCCTAVSLSVEDACCMHALLTDCMIRTVPEVPPGPAPPKYL